MRVVGVDLAAQPGPTSVATLDWADRPRVVDLVSGADDAAVLAAARGAAGIGLDCPFGWPDGFVEVVRRHHAGQSVADHPWTPRQLRLRMTDEATRARTGRDPLSVSTDKLGIVALRGIRILELVAGVGADRSGAAGVYEVYPAGALAVWGLPSRGYKRREGAAVRERLVAELGGHCDLGGAEDRLRGCDDDLDAVIAALITGLAVQGRTHTPPADQAAVAAREGWIHVPLGPLDDIGHRKV